MQVLALRQRNKAFSACIEEIAHWPANAQDGKRLIWAQVVRYLGYGKRGTGPANQRPIPDAIASTQIGHEVHLLVDHREPSADEAATPTRRPLTYSPGLLVAKVRPRSLAICSPTRSTSRPTSVATMRPGTWMLPSLTVASPISTNRCARRAIALDGALLLPVSGRCLPRIGCVTRLARLH